MNKMAKLILCRGWEQRRATTRVCHAMAGGDAGQAIVELALLLPFFLLLIVGTAEFGRLAYASIEVGNAANAGAHYGAQSHVTASDIAGMRTAAINDAADITAGLTATPAPKHMCSCSNVAGAPATATCSTTCSSPGILLEYVQVNTSATVNPLIHYPGLPTTFTLKGQAIMRVEQ